MNFFGNWLYKLHLLCNTFYIRGIVYGASKFGQICRINSSILISLLMYSATAGSFKICVAVGRFDGSSCKIQNMKL